MYVNRYNRQREVSGYYRHSHSSQGAPKLADYYLVLTLSRVPLSNILADPQLYGNFKFEIFKKQHFRVYFHFKKYNFVV